MAALAFALVGCDSEDVTGPVQVAVPPPTGQQGATTTYSITVTASPDAVDLNAGSAVVQIEVRAVRADNNRSVAPDTTALLTTTAGQLTSAAGTAASVPIVFDVGGVARATLTLSAADLINEGVVLVRAQIENSVGTEQIRILNVPPEVFQLLDVSPSVGPPSGGTTLSIIGTGFRSPAIGTISVLGSTLPLEDVQVVSSTRISARTPPINLPSGQNGLASITIQNGPDGAGNPGGSDTLAGAFTYTRSSAGATTLKVISLSPTFGPNEGGTQVSILGEGFGDSVQVYFTNGPLVEAQVLSVTPNRIEVVTPSATGPNAANGNAIVDVRVIDPVSGQQATIAGAYQYGRGGGGGLFISAISPGQGEYTGGDLVTIFGQGFEEPVAVTMGGVGQQIISVTGTEVVVRTVPVQISCNQTQAGPTSITNIETNTGATGPTFTYVPVEPTILSVTPASGDEDGGTMITIEGIARSFGVGFDPPLQVTINGVPATDVTLVDSDTISAVVPAFTGTFATQDCATGNGSGSQQVPTSVNVTVTNVNTGCNDTLSNGFTYNPDNNSCVVPVSAAFTFNGASGSFDVNFFDQSSGNILTYDWDFGDGTGSVEQNPSHTYALPGSYTVTLTVFDGTTSDSSSQTVEVPLP